MSVHSYNIVTKPVSFNLSLLLTILIPEMDQRPTKKREMCSLYGAGNNHRVVVLILVIASKQPPNSILLLLELKSNSVGAEEVQIGFM